MQVFDAATVKTEALKKAFVSMEETKASIKRVLETIEHGKKNEATAENPSLLTADEVKYGATLTSINGGTCTPSILKFALLGFLRGLGAF